MNINIISIVKLLPFLLFQIQNSYIFKVFRPPSIPIINMGYLKKNTVLETKTLTSSSYFVNVLRQSLKDTNQYSHTFVFCCFTLKIFHSRMKTQRKVNSCYRKRTKSFLTGTAIFNFQQLFERNQLHINGEKLVIKSQNVEEKIFAMV